MDAAFILREKEIGLGRFPAIVHPKPIFRCDANLLFDDLIYFCSERGNGGVCLGRIKALGENHAPTPQTRRVNACGDSAALVLLASKAGRGEVDASFPKKGVHSP